MPAPVYGYSAEAPLAPGLDPKRFRATVLIDRIDDKPLTAADPRAIEAAYPPPAAKRAAARGVPASRRPARFDENGKPLAKAKPAATTKRKVTPKRAAARRGGAR